MKITIKLTSEDKFMSTDFMILFFPSTNFPDSHIGVPWRNKLVLSLIVLENVSPQEGQ